MTRFCEACLTIFADHSVERYDPSDDLPSEDGCRPPPIDIWHGHHPTADLHRKAILEGCILCSWIPDPGLDNYQTFFRFDRYYRRLESGVKEEICDIHLGLPDRNRLSEKRDDRTPFVRIETKVCGADETVLEQLATASRNCTSTGHADVLHLAKGWLSGCLNTHQDCVRTIYPSWLPTRLLTLSNSRATLVDTAEHVPTGPYATLSHCWGGMPSFVLNSDNIDTFKQGIDFSQFDPTFRDAMAVAQTLGIDYLWIDCYCIIQGTDTLSRLDWSRESVLMHKVYTNALLNIGAAHGKDSQAGCFRSRQRQEDVFGQVFWKQKSDSLRTMYKLINPAFRNKEWEEIQSAVRRFAIFDRGWVVQERILAQRMLYFGNGGIFWDCASTEIKSEQWPWGQNVGLNPLEPEEQNLGVEFLAPGRLNGLQELQGDRRHSVWSSALDWYSRCKLSFPEKDKTVAFEGVGRRIYELTGEEYSNGFPRASFPISLCWSSTGLDGCKDPTAPSWHWASSRHVRWFNFGVARDDTDPRPSVSKYRSLVAMISRSTASPKEEAFGPFLCIGRLIWIPFVRSSDDSFSATLNDFPKSTDRGLPTRREADPSFLSKPTQSTVRLIPDDFVEFGSMLDEHQLFLLPIWWRLNWGWPLGDQGLYWRVMRQYDPPRFHPHEPRDITIESRTLQNLRAMHHGEAEPWPNFCAISYGGLVVKGSVGGDCQRVGIFEVKRDFGDSGVKKMYQAMSLVKPRLIIVT